MPHDPEVGIGNCAEGNGSNVASQTCWKEHRDARKRENIGEIGKRKSLAFASPTTEDESTKDCFDGIRQPDCRADGKREIMPENMTDCGCTPDCCNHRWPKACWSNDQPCQVDARGRPDGRDVVFEEELHAKVSSSEPGTEKKQQRNTASKTREESAKLLRY